MTDRFFGLLIICASCGMRFIKNNYLFLMTGMGKGFFNVFVGSLLCSINTELLNLIMGPCIMGSGLIFIFLSIFKNMSDDELQRAVSVQKSDMMNAGKKALINNKEAIYKTAYDNKDVIAEVAYDNRDVIAQAAYNNRELLAD